MAYGIRITNEGANELTFADGGRIFSYIGKASLQLLEQPTAAVGQQSRFAGRGTYSINWNGDIVVGILLKDGRYSSIISKSRSGNVHTIIAYSDNGVRDSDGFGTQEETEIHVWGESREVDANGYGISIYDDDGNILSVLKAPPLSYQHLHISDGENTVEIPSISKILIVGNNASSSRTSVRIGTTFKWKITQDAACWSLSTAFGMTRLTPNFYSRQVDYEDGAGTSVRVYRGSVALIVDAGTL